MASPLRADRPDGPTLPRFAALMAGNAMLALGPWFVRLADSGPVAAGFWRLALALPVLALLVRWREPGVALPVTGAALLAVTGAGVMFGLDLAAWHIGIEATRMGNATLFGNSGSLMLMAWAFIAVRRAPRAGEVAAIALAIAGAALLMGRSAELSRERLVGDLFCLLAGVFYAFYIVWMQGVRARSGPFGTLLMASLAGAPVLLGVALLLREPVWPGNWWPLIGLALSSQIIGQGLLVASLRHFGPLTIGLVLLTQPAVAVLVGWLAFAETLGPLDALGMAAIAAALVLGRAAPPPPAPLAAAGRRTI